MQHANEGNDIVQKANRGMNEMGHIAAKSTKNMEALSEASERQSRSIAEINVGIGKINDVVLANSDMAELSATAAETMATQADHLKSVVSKFRIKDELR
jgi:methyl-accepting chemotaxis protein